MALIGKESLVRRKFVNVPKLPNVVQKLGNKKKMLIPVVIVLVLAGGFGVHGLNRHKARKAMAEKMSQVETTTVTKQNLVDSISVTGTVNSADARDVSAIASNVEVETVNYKVGDYVNEGDVVVVLDSSELERKLKEAQNSQALSEYNENKSIETASESYTQAVEDGTDDYSKAVKNEAQAKEDLQDAEGDLSSAAEALKKQEERVSELQASYDAQTEVAKKAELETELSAAKAEYTSRHQAYTAAKEAEEKASDAYETAAENLETATKQNDRNISNAADSLEKAQMQKTYSNDSSDQSIDNYQEQIEACTVTAPISGVITAMNVEEGDTYLGEGKALFTIADEQNYIVSASVDEYDISSISADMTAAVIVEALGEDELAGKVSFVSPVATTSNAGSSSYSIEIALDEPNSNLRIGMTAKASIVKDAVYDVLTVPYDCVTADEDGNFYVNIDQNGEKTQVPVTVGMESDYYIEISGDGIDENTKVYYSTPLINQESTGDSGNVRDGITFDMGGGMQGGGGAPGGGGTTGGGRPSGGGPGGF